MMRIRSLMVSCLVACCILPTTILTTLDGGSMPSIDSANLEAITIADIQAAAASGWTTIENITTGEISHTPLQLSSPSRVIADVDVRGNVHVVWPRERGYLITDPLRYAQVYYTCRNASTETWSTPLGLLPEFVLMDYLYDRPAIKCDRFGNVNFVFAMSNTTEGGSDIDIYHRRWNATSGQISPLVLVSTSSTVDSVNPSLDMDAWGNVLIMWCENKTNLYYRLYTPWLNSWSVPVSFQNNTSGSYAMSIDSKSRWHVAWTTEEHLYYRRHVPSMPWLPTETLATSRTPYPSVRAIKADGYGRVHAIWHDGIRGNPLTILINGSFLHQMLDLDGQPGSNWTSAELILPNLKQLNGTVEMDISQQGILRVAWRNETDSSIDKPDVRLNDIFYASWDLVSGMGSSVVHISTGYFGDNPAMNYSCDEASLVFDGAVHVVWSVRQQVAYHPEKDALSYSRRVIPLDPPAMKDVVPNPVSDGVVLVSWEPLPGATRYFVYKSSTPILSVVGLEPMPQNEGGNFFVNATTYMNVVQENGLFYYVVVASNLYTNSTPSRSVLVVTGASLPSLTAPALHPFLPGPDTDGIVQLNWTSVSFATVYFVYRDALPFTTIGTRVPIAITNEPGYVDSGLANGTYYYAIVAGNTDRNSTLSTYQAVLVTIPSQNQDPGIVSPGIDPVPAIITSSLIFLGIGVITGFLASSRRHRRLSNAKQKRS